MQNEKEDFQKIYTADNQFQADFIAGELRKRAIQVMIRSYQDKAYDGIYVLQKGWGILLVPKHQVKRAKAIIEKVIEDLHSSE